MVRLSFYELVSRAAFTKTYQEKVYWEIWRIQLKIVTSNQSVEGESYFLCLVLAS